MATPMEIVEARQPRIRGETL
ncbi:uncharacterized protein G2W53_036582 [Senna tora]|uniref:Uncharacterized protein n=1 Tax=Senna tora TaxID=362788 RepID=A0A834WAD6_9FABA|nr:uncharacterized protein G2W53_036582 [Senna tora]